MHLGYQPRFTYIVLSLKVCLRRRNRKLQTASVTVSSIENIRCEYILHSLQPHDLTPSDFGVLGTLKYALNEGKFRDGDDARPAMHEGLTTLPE